MRSQLWLLAAASHLASADEAFGQDLDYRGGEAAYLVPLPRETRASTHDGANGWSPRPTDGPSVELVRRRQDWAFMKRQTSANTWVDDTTCGWRAQTVSEPFTCPSAYTCATNTDQVVGCTSSGAANPFFTVCLDYAAVQAGACQTVGPKTGCCMTSSLGECITYLWPGSTAKLMYRCYTERAIITMLETPWLASTSATTTRSSSSTSSRSTTSSTGSAPAQSTTGSPPPTSDGGSNNTGAIVGGVVGGVAGIALIAGAIAYVVISSRKKNNSNVGAGTAYSAVAPGDTGYPGSPMPPTAYAPSSLSPQTTQAGYFGPGSVGTQSAFYDPAKPADQQQGGYMAPPVPGAYDPRQSYYDPSKPPDQQQPGYAVPPGAYGPYAGAHPYPGAHPQHGAYPGGYPQQAASELDNTTVAAGQQGNPVEMAAVPATPR